MNLCQTEVTGQTLSNNSIDVLCFSSHDLKANLLYSKRTLRSLHYALFGSNALEFCPKISHFSGQFPPFRNTFSESSGVAKRGTTGVNYKLYSSNLEVIKITMDPFVTGYS